MITKIKRTLPSVSEHHTDPFYFSSKDANANPSNRNSIQSANYYSVNEFSNIEKLRRMSISSKRASGDNFSEPIGKDQERSVNSNKKTVTFVNLSKTASKAPRERIPIFSNSPLKKKQSGSSILTTISIKELSENIIKLKNMPTRAEEHLVERISELENAIVDIKSELSQSRKKQKAKNIQTHQAAVPQKEAQPAAAPVNMKLLALQQEQMKRCQILARQNQILNNNLMNKQHRGKEYRQESNKNSKLRFEDLQESDHIFQDESSQTSIVSPFEYDDNKKALKLKR